MDNHFHPLKYRYPTRASLAVLISLWKVAVLMEFKFTSSEVVRDHDAIDLVLFQPRSRSSSAIWDVTSPELSKASSCLVGLGIDVCGARGGGGVGGLVAVSCKSVGI